MTKAIDYIDTEAVPKIAEHLNQVVADSYGLLGQLHLAHWNVEGTDFKQLHELFQAQYEELFVAIDDIAERVRALGQYAEGGVKRLAAMSNVTEGPTKQSQPSDEWVSSILLAHETVIDTLIEARKFAASHDDAETEDLLIARVQVHQKAVWFLNSYLKRR